MGRGWPAIAESGTRRDHRSRERAGGFVLKRAACSRRSTRRCTSAPAASAALLLSLLGAACSGAQGSESRSLYELERMVLVPAVPRTRLAGFSGPDADLSIPEPLLVDRFEVTRADLAHYRWPAGETWDGTDGTEGRRDHWPAALSFVAARNLAERRGMRLLTPREWIHVAVGPRGHNYPWGPNFQISVANTLDLGLGRPADTGTFERGKSHPYGCYDLLGNVWEWVDGVVPGYYDSQEERTMLAHPRRASAMGGSFLSVPRATFGLIGKTSRPEFHAITLDVAHQASDLGVRLGIEARPWLLEHAAGWGGDDATRARLRAVGESWGRDAVDFLESLGSAEDAPPLLSELVEGARRAAP